MILAGSKVKWDSSSPWISRSMRKSSSFVHYYDWCVTKETVRLEGRTSLKINHHPSSETEAEADSRGMGIGSYFCQKNAFSV